MSTCDVRRFSRLAFALLTGGALTLASTVAAASLPFPDTIRSHWDVRRLPVSGLGCRLCHANDTGGLENLNQRFGLTVKALRVSANNTRSLERALDDIETRGTDSDRDGATDYEEIVEDATNPSDSTSRRPPDPPMNRGGEGGTDGTGGADDGTGGEPPIEVPEPLPPLPELPPPLEHGCALAPAGTGTGVNGVVGMLLSLGVLGRTRRRAQRRT